MNGTDTPPTRWWAHDPRLAARIEARVVAAEALRRLGHALVGHDVDDDLVARIASFASEALTEAAGFPTRDRLTEMTSHPRFAEALRRGRIVAELPDGAVMDLFLDSFVSGPANPMGIALTIVRDHDEVVARTTLGPAFEGAPGRGHGGIVSAIIDETMGGILPIIGEPAFTGRLTIDYLAATPVGEELEFRARLLRRTQRKLFIECVGSHAGEQFVRAEGVFVVIDLARFAGIEPTRRTDSEGGRA